MCKNSMKKVLIFGIKSNYLLEDMGKLRDELFGDVLHLNNKGATLFTKEIDRRLHEEL